MSIVWLFYMTDRTDFLTSSSVDSNETAKLGWSRGTYFDTYAPALAKMVWIYYSFTIAD